MYLRKYGEATTINFPLIDAGAQDFEATPVTFAAGDTQVSKDEGAFANAGSNPAHEGNGIYSLALTAAEMTAARVVVTVIDAATKEWEDQAIVIDTYGGPSAQHSVDLIADHVLRRSLASAQDGSDGDAKAFRSLLGAVAKLVNKVSISGNTLSVKETDDSTELGSQTVTRSTTAKPIVGVDTD